MSLQPRPNDLSLGFGFADIARFSFTGQPLGHLDPSAAERTAEERRRIAWALQCETVQYYSTLTQNKKVVPTKRNKTKTATDVRSQSRRRGRAMPFTVVLYLQAMLCSAVQHKQHLTPVQFNMSRTQFKNRSTQQLSTASTCQHVL